LYRAEAAKRQLEPVDPFRASSMGHCIRQGCFDLLGLKGEPLQPRRVAVFKHGDLIHSALTDDLCKALGWRWVPGPDFEDCFVEIDGAKISYHIDGAFQLDGIAHTGSGWIGIVEFKSMSDYAFEKAKKGEIDHVYLCQAYIYCVGSDFNPVVFIAYRKETSHMVEIVFDRTATEKIVTQRLTGDPITLAKEDPLMLTEIRTPFDPSVEEYVRNRIKWLKLTKEVQEDVELNRLTLKAYDSLADWALEDVPGADAVENETVKIQGQANAVTFEHDNPEVKAVGKNGSWFSYETGRRILGFPCNYCRHLKTDFPEARMEMKGDKPIWVIP
jgi:hypothetical protein